MLFVVVHAVLALQKKKKKKKYIYLKSLLIQCPEFILLFIKFNCYYYSNCQPIRSQTVDINSHTKWQTMIQIRSQLIWIYTEKAGHIRLHQDKDREPNGTIKSPPYFIIVHFFFNFSSVTEPNLVSCKIQGPVVQSVISLTSSLRVISLTVLADSIYNILIFFAEKCE